MLVKRGPKPMQIVESKRIRSNRVFTLGICLLALSSLGFGQDDQGQAPNPAPPPQTNQARPGNWRYFANPPQNQGQNPAPVVDAPPGQQQGDYPPQQGDNPPQGYPSQSQGNYQGP